MIAIVDYGMGNLRSIERALFALGADALVTREPEQLRDAERIVLPGVGAFGRAMERLRSSGLDQLLTELVMGDRKPLLGICLGMQLICKDSEEHGHHQGLGWLDAHVRRFSFPRGGQLRIPHVGWNEVEGRPDRVIAPDGGAFYFAHSFHVTCNDPEDVAAVCVYGKEFPAAVESDNILAAQFHPEKSQDEGLTVLRRFLGFDPSVTVAAA